MAFTKQPVVLTLKAFIAHTVLQDWHLRRFLGLGAGLFLGVQSIIIQDGVMGLASAFFLFQSLMNTGCFGRTGCAVPYQEVPSEENKEIEFTEVK